MENAVSEALRALLANLIDYAGLYPPAALPRAGVPERYDSYLVADTAWMLNRVVLPKREGTIEPRWRVTMLVDQEPGPLPPQVETLETRLAHRLSLPTYCEAPLGQITDGFAKIRTGGLTPEAIPAPETIADFLGEAAQRRLPFKATAGLHHPVRSLRPLTYAADSPRAVMHGFLNVFTAASFAWHGGDRDLLLGLLNEEDPHAFDFTAGELRWRGRRLGADQITGARRDFAHSFGSCSFEEPIADLQELG